MSCSPPPFPQVLHPSGLSWLLKCDVASSLLICHILLPLVAVMILLSFFYKEVGIQQLDPGRRECWMRRVTHWIGWPEAGWSRGVGVAGGEALVSLTGCSPSSFLLFNPKQEKVETTVAQRSLGKEKVHILLECLSPLLFSIGTS